MQSFQRTTGHRASTFKILAKCLTFPFKSIEFKTHTHTLKKQKLVKQNNGNVMTIF